mmetsp:Transcript_25775/g.28664  ORF Transcript_25775/g.28664 Transcript_25775/m.28664 type:complete len:261 (+) Transcript_25775:95-877(+)
MTSSRIIDYVKISRFTFGALVTHALSTEREEILGMLIGKITSDKGTVGAVVQHIKILERADKRKDRVEATPIQLDSARQLAEQLDARVIGWYHSHPHITIQPSPVDLRNQWTNQQMGDFFGIIVSVFDHDNDNKGTIRLKAFQTIERSEEKTIEIQIVPDNQVLFSAHPSNFPNQLVELAKILFKEETKYFQAAMARIEASGASQLEVIRAQSVHQTAVTALLQYYCKPLIAALQSTLNVQERLQVEMKKEISLARAGGE